MTQLTSEHRAAFRPPPGYWPEPLTTARLARLWRMSARLVGHLIDKGLLVGERGPNGSYQVTRANAEAFARHAIRMREVRVGMTVRNPRWAGGAPLSVVEMRLVDQGTKWQLGTRLDATAAVVYPRPSDGDHIVLHVPARSATEGPLT